MQQDSLIGKTIGSYFIQDSLGEGGMARVYKAYHTRLQRYDALKVIASDVADDPEFKARFEREAQFVARLEHPNIVKIYDFGEYITPDQKQVTYLAMQYVAGGTLRDQLTGGRPITALRAAGYALQMARALYHAHQHGIVHRDIKPQNMLVSSNNPDQILLSDFGIAKVFDSSQELTLGSTSLNLSPTRISHDLNLTSAGVIIGTFAYMAPEQILHKPVDARTDIYSLGVVLFQMLTGRVPFQSDTSQGLMYQHVYSAPLPPQQLNPTVPLPLAGITARALEKQPEQRFQDAAEMARALEQAINILSAGPEASVLPSSSYPSASPYPSSQPSLASQPFSQQTPYPSHLQLSPNTPQPIISHNNAYLPTSITPASSLARPTPTAPRKQKISPTTLVTSIILVVIAAVLIAFRVVPSLTNQPIPLISTPTPGPATTFTETFADNTRQWNTSPASGLTATIENNTYVLTTDNKNQTHFPHPAQIGALPKSFTISARFQQTAGSTDSLYGLAFYLKYSDNQPQSCYAFVINSNGGAALIKCQPKGSVPPFSNLNSNQPPAINKGLNQTNALQITVNNGTFTCKINDQPVQWTGGKNTLTDTDFSEGQLGLLVTDTNQGNGNSFTVTQFQFTTG